LLILQYYDHADGPLHPEFFEDLRFREATRLIEVKLHIVPQTEIRFFPPSEIQSFCSQRHQVTFFHGISEGVNGNEATVEGYVRAVDGTVRWRLVSIRLVSPWIHLINRKLSIYDNSPQWRLGLSLVWEPYKLTPTSAPVVCKLVMLVVQEVLWEYGQLQRTSKVCKIKIEFLPSLGTEGQ